jgi:hypothetical protein
MVPVKAAAILIAVTALVPLAVAFRQVPLTDTRGPVGEKSSAADSDSVTRTSMRNVNFWVIPTAALRIRIMRGSTRSLTGGPVLFDDKNSFVIHLSYADIGLNGNDITELMNRHIFAYRGAPLKKLKVHTAGSRLVQSGIMHKILDIPFEMTADPTMTPEGLRRLHPVKMRILGVDGLALMRAFNLSLGKILDLSGAKGVTVKGNDLFLNPTMILPPPATEGHATGVRIEGDELITTFGSPADAPELTPPDTTVPGYMYYKGGTLRFGKLMMLGADMEIVDRKPTGFFNFELDRYKEQLVAGYSRTLPNMGLEVYMLGLEKLGHASTDSVKPGR